MKALFYGLKPLYIVKTAIRNGRLWKCGMKRNNLFFGMGFELVYKLVSKKVFFQVVLQGSISEKGFE